MSDAVRPPRSEDELMTNALRLAGRSVAQLADRVKQRVPDTQARHKGWVGNLLEANLGATAGSKAAMDFQRIGVEMKTIPIGKKGVPTESTYVCTARLVDLSQLTWEVSWVRKKLSRVLWIPIQADKAIPLAQRRVGSPLLWSPDAEEDDILRTDWTELTGMIRLGEVEDIRAHMGRWLQIRPKAADSRSTTWGVDAEGFRARTLPRGFYLRALFTRRLLEKNFAMPSAS